jgi:hypothetical protein
MIRKLCTAVATAALLVGASLGMAGVANAATPAPIAKTAGIGDIIGGGGVCSILGGVLTGTNCPGSGHRVGGGFHGGRYFHDGFRGGRWLGGGSQTIIVNGSNYGVSDCGCGNDQVILTPQVVSIPRGAVETGDGSCVTTLSSANFGRFGGLRGFHRGLHWVR